MRTITFNETELDMIVRALNCKSRRVKSRIANRVKRLADPGIDNDFRANTEEYIRRGGENLALIDALTQKISNS